MLSEPTKRNWWVKLPGRAPFTMGGEPMTYDQALATARAIWPLAEVE